MRARSSLECRAPRLGRVAVALSVALPVAVWAQGAHTGSLAPDAPWIVHLAVQCAPDVFHRIPPGACRSGAYKIDPTRLRTRIAPVPVVTDMAVGSVHAHPSGERIAFIAAQGRGAGSSIQVLEPTGARRVVAKTAFDAHGVQLSPDGRRLAFHGDRRIWVLDIDARTAPRAVTPEVSSAQSIAEQGRHAAHPTWSTTGERIFYNQFRMSPNEQGHPVVSDLLIGSVTPDGTDPIEISPLPAMGVLGRLVATPDGGGLVYVSGSERLADLYRLNLADRSTSLVVADARSPAFSASGAHLAFVRGRATLLTCRVVDARCAGTSVVTRAATSVDEPSWIER